MKNYNSDAWMARLITQTFKSDDKMSGNKKHKKKKHLNFYAKKKYTEYFCTLLIHPCVNIGLRSFSQQ